jgi:hypothetical protein
VRSQKRDLVVLKHGCRSPAPLPSENECECGTIETRWSGGTGRRTGLKIPRPSLVMRVRPSPPAPTKSFHHASLHAFLLPPPDSVSLDLHHNFLHNFLWPGLSWRGSCGTWPCARRSQPHLSRLRWSSGCIVACEVRLVGQEYCRIRRAFGQHSNIDRTPVDFQGSKANR